MRSLYLYVTGYVNHQNEKENKMRLFTFKGEEVQSIVTTRKIMLLVLIALLPTTVFGVLNFGLSALMVIGVTVVSAVLTEYIYQKIFRKTVTINDFSAVVTGLLLALNMPATVPWWICVIGSVFAILVIKQLFGGLGENFINPAIGARCFLLIAFAGRMTTFVYGDVTVVTPIELLKAGEKVNLFDMFIGNVAGTIGETSVVAILLGAIFLLLTGIIDIIIPGTYIATFVLFIIVFSGHGLDRNYILAHLFSGGLMLGAWFMATDYATSPVTKKGKMLYGICLGIFTGLYRFFGGISEGVVYAIIIGNLLSPLIERVARLRLFGKSEEKQ